MPTDHSQASYPADHFHHDHIADIAYHSRQIRTLAVKTRRQLLSAGKAGRHLDHIDRALLGLITVLEAFDKRATLDDFASSLKSITQSPR